MINRPITTQRLWETVSMGTIMGAVFLDSYLVSTNKRVWILRIGAFALLPVAGAVELAAAGQTRTIYYGS
jgi:hypothetical protein